MRTSLSAEQRDALYQLILDRLSGIGDIWLRAQEHDYESATKLGWEYSDELRLILEDLGWGQGSGQSIELSAPPDVLRRVFSRLRDMAAGQRAAEKPEWAEMHEREERNRLVAEACEKVIAGLEAEAA